MIHPLIMRFEHDDVALAVAAHAFGFAQIGLWHLPGKQKRAHWREFLHPASHVHRIQVVLLIHRHRTRLVQLTESNAPRADDLDPAKELALEGNAVRAGWRRAGSQQYRKESDAYRVLRA